MSSNLPTMSITEKSFDKWERILNKWENQGVSGLLFRTSKWLTEYVFVYQFGIGITWIRHPLDSRHDRISWGETFSLCDPSILGQRPICTNRRFAVSSRTDAIYQKREGRRATWLKWLQAGIYLNSEIWCEYKLYSGEKPLSIIQA